MGIIIRSGLMVVAIAAVVGGATTAYFSDTDTSGDNTFTAGTLTINIDQTTNSRQTSFTNLQPGDSNEVQFEVKNTGSLPVHLRGFALGEWASVASPDNTNMKVTKVEYYDSGWVTLIQNSAGLTGEYYYSSNGTAGGTLMELAGGAIESFKLTVEFDSAAGNEYQGKVYTTQLNVEAKQVNNASWL